MPHVILEYSSNIVEKNNISNLFQECHSILEETLPTEIASCKSRAIECNNYYVGNGDPNNAFVSVTLKVMPGRSVDTLQNVADKIMAALKIYFENSLKNLNLQITLEIIELQKIYLKIKGRIN